MYFDRKGITEDFVAALLPLISAEGYVFSLSRPEHQFIF
jgi:hypothetical protein